MAHQKLLQLLLLLILIAACAPSPATDSSIAKTEGTQVRVVATTTLIADIAANVGGGQITVTPLLPLGADPHTFEPTPQDVATVADAHLLLVNGLGLEEFLEPLLRNAAGQAVVVVVSEGIAPRKTTDTHPEEDEHEGVDPHVWTTPANGAIFTDNIAAALIALDPPHADTYRANAATYQKELTTLDEWIKAQIETLPPDNRVLVTDHAVFGYYADRYGLEQIGTVLPGFSAAAQPSAQELAALQQVMAQYQVKTIFVGTTVNTALAAQIAQDSGLRLAQVYTDSLGPPGSEAETYLEYLRYNTTTFVAGLQ
jgi:ABC-type Zn uptake system ZnuABC Zn-binding protein ZnuA